MQRNDEFNIWRSTMFIAYCYDIHIHLQTVEKEQGQNQIRIFVY